MLELKVGDRVRTREDGVTGTVYQARARFRAPARHRLGRRRAKRDFAERGFGRTPRELWPI
jgi:hypothetical protein